MSLSDNASSISKLEIGTFAVILSIGLLFGFYIVDRSGFVDESKALNLVQQQRNISNVIGSMENLSRTFDSEFKDQLLINKDLLLQDVENTHNSLSQTFKDNKLKSSENKQLVENVEHILNDILKWLTEGTEQHSADSRLVVEMSLERLKSSITRFKELEESIRVEQEETIKTYHGGIETFRGSLITLLLGTTSLITLLIALNARQRQSQTNLALERKLISDSVNNLDEGVVLTDLEDRCVVVNKTLSSLCPALANKLTLGKSFEDAFSASLRRGELKLIKDQTHHLVDKTKLEHNSNHTKSAKEYLTKSGTYLKITKRETKSTGRIITFSDITYLKTAQQQLHRQATKDGLTGLANRNFFMEKLAEALDRSNRFGHKVALMVFDLDRFKQVNDTLGHAVGDELLRSVANRIKANLRTIDVSARMGGDEFSAYLDQIKDTREIKITADRILKELHQRLEIEGIDVEVSSSIGIALYPDDADSLSDLLKHADSACYQAKQMGRNNYQIYNKDMKVQALRQMTMESCLRTAITENTLALNYQPQLNLADNVIDGVEAFIRWNDPKLGNVTPDQFIPLAEKTGLIAEIGEWVIRHACQQIRHWMDQGHSPVQVAVNLSPRQFRLQNLPNIIDKALSDFDVSPSMLALEITESVIMSDLHTAVETLQELGDRGLTLIIDDFGAGSSALYRLKELPIHALKIDQSFIKDMIESENARDITGAIIAIAQKLNLKTIAEGVETEEQVRILSGLGCDAIQGYLLQKPSAADELLLCITPEQLNYRAI